jgi:aspartokinase
MFASRNPTVAPTIWSSVAGPVKALKTWSMSAIHSSSVPSCAAMNFLAATMFKALAHENINIKVITTSEIKISVLIDRKYMELAVQSLHDAFGLEKVG